VAGVEAVVTVVAVTDLTSPQAANAGLAVFEQSHFLDLGWTGFAGCYLGAQKGAARTSDESGIASRRTPFCASFSKAAERES
jgi:hypothetical protein